MTIESAPPVNQRPRCLACGNRLKPNYNTETTSYADERKIKRLFEDWNWNHTGKEPVTSNSHGAKQDDKGRWYVERAINSVKSRKWKGTYGHAGFFCGINCAAQWACAVADKLKAEGRQLIIYKETT